MDISGTALEKTLAPAQFAESSLAESSLAASSLAQAPIVETSFAQTGFAEMPVLIFRLGAALFGIPALAVREIQALPALSPLQETAPFIVGVLNLRGAIVPVMDLNARFGQPPTPYLLNDSLIVLHWNGSDVAIIVNEVRSVGRLLASQIEATPTHGRRHDLPAPFVAGVTQLEESSENESGGIVMLLHLPNLLEWTSPQDSPIETTARFDGQTWTTAERAVLEERAAHLRPAAQNEAQNDTERMPVAIVALGGEEFGIELDAVREFVAVSSIAPVPCCPPHILGQINLRGDIVTLVDVRSILATGDTTNKRQTMVPVVVVQHEGAPIGIVIDDVRDVLYLRSDERLALEAGLQRSGQGGRYFSGGALESGRLLPLLDVERLFAEGNLEVDEGA